MQKNQNSGQADLVADLECDYREGVLRIYCDDQGDVYLTIGPHGCPVQLSGPSVRIAASGTRHPAWVRKAFIEIARNVAAGSEVQQ